MSKEGYERAIGAVQEAQANIHYALSELPVVPTGTSQLLGAMLLSLDFMRKQWQEIVDKEKK